MSSPISHVASALIFRVLKVKSMIVCMSSCVSWAGDRYCHQSARASRPIIILLFLFDVKGKKYYK